MQKREHKPLFHGCPGSRMMTIKHSSDDSRKIADTGDNAGQKDAGRAVNLESQLNQ